MDCSGVETTRPTQFIPRQVFNSPPLPTEGGKEGETTVATKPKKAKKKRSWRREYNCSAESGNRDYQPSDDDPDSSGNEGTSEPDTDPEDDFEPGDVVEGQRLRTKKEPGHKLGEFPEVKLPSFHFPEFEPQLEEVVRPSVPAPVAPAVVIPAIVPVMPPAAPAPAPVGGAAQPVQFQSQSRESSRRVVAGPVALNLLRQFDQHLGATQALLERMVNVKQEEIPEAAEDGWVVPQKPSAGSADMHHVSILAQLREVSKHASKALVATRAVRGPLVLACIAKNKRRRVQEATTTRESLRDQNEALQAQIRQNQKEMKLRHLREDRVV
jgi:hypothetical protein